MTDRNDELYKSIFKVLGSPTRSIPGLSPPPPQDNLIRALTNARLTPPPRLTKKAMALRDELLQQTEDIFRSHWETRDGEVVPEPEDLQLGNNAVNLDATILYADINGSTSMVDHLSPTLAAEVYKAYLNCAARIIKANGGVITAYDGDRVMAVFAKGAKNTNAARTALNINWAVSTIVNPGLKKQYGANAYQMSHVVGIDSSKVLVSRIGVRNDNDLVWVGRAANYAAKLSAINGEFSAWITDAVFDVMVDEAKYQEGTRTPMWTERRWNNMRIYGSNWWWKV